MHKKAINTDKLNKGESYFLEKTYDNEGRICKNGSILVGVKHNNEDANLFIHPGFETDAAVNTINSLTKGSSFELKRQKDGVFVVLTNGESGTTDHKVDMKDDIKWGMAFNNCTRVACSLDMSGQDKIEFIKNNVHELYNIAQSQTKTDNVPF